MSEWELLIRYDVPALYVVEAMPSGFRWTVAERTAPYWRLVRVSLLPVEIDWLKEPRARVLGEDAARVRSLNRLALPSLPREGVTPIARDRFLAAVQ